MPPLRVAHLTTVASSLRYLLLPQLTAVVDAGGQAVGISAPGDDVAVLRAAGIGHRPLPSSTRGLDLRRDLRAARELWRILRRERFDVLHTHNPKPGIYGRVVGRIAGVPVVVHTTHGLYASPDDRRAKRAVVYALEAIASRFSDAELVQNPEDLALMLRLRLSSAAKTRLLGNGIDLTRFDPDRVGAGDRERLRAELGAAPDDVVVTSVGRLVAEKGYRELFEAAARLGPRHVVVVVGPDDPTKGDALTGEDLARARDTGVRFLGMRDDIEAVLAATDVFTLPSHREGFPRAAMEAAAMGLPIVATDVRGCREVVAHDVNGLLVPVRDAVALATAIERLGADAALRRRLGSAGRERAARCFDERRVVDIVLATYADAHARRSRARTPGRGRRPPGGGVGRPGAARARRETVA
jgi:glycosyltransferase involved in cell wall biosynthesis